MAGSFERMFTDLLPVMEEMDMDEVGRLVLAVTKYHSTGEETPLPRELRYLFLCMKGQMDRAERDRENGRRGGRPRKRARETEKPRREAEGTERNAEKAFSGDAAAVPKAEKTVAQAVVTVPKAEKTDPQAAAAVPKSEKILPELFRDHAPVIVTDEPLPWDDPSPLPAPTPDPVPAADGPLFRDDPVPLPPPSRPHVPAPDEPLLWDDPMPLRRSAPDRRTAPGPLPEDIAEYCRLSGIPLGLQAMEEMRGFLREGMDPQLITYACDQAVRPVPRRRRGPGHPAAADLCHQL